MMITTPLTIKETHHIVCQPTMSLFSEHGETPTL